MIVILDAGPLGMVSNSKATPAHLEAMEWVRALTRNRHRIVIPEIADYEIRRNMILEDLRASVARLDGLRSTLEYLPITTHAMEQAARFWADSRKRGLPTTDKKRLDADAILAGQAATHPDGGANVVLATSNVRHLARFVPAELWHKIR